MDKIDDIVKACLDNAAHYDLQAKTCPADARRCLRNAWRWRKLAAYWREFADLGGSAFV